MARRLDAHVPRTALRCPIGCALLFTLAHTSFAAEELLRQTLNQSFTTRVRPFVQKYCRSCHGPDKQEANLNLAEFTSVDQVTAGHKTWALVRDRLLAEEMPPEDAPVHPAAEERQAIIDWIQQLHDHEATRNAGDPGIVLARRLSNAEYDYTIRDLTGVDLRPTREFPVDPANEAGFDNSGESLTMSPALAKKYLAAARSVSEHVVFVPEGLRFAPHPVVTETDRDKYCVLRIVDFYRRHEVDLTDYFFAAWQFEYRAELGQAETTLEGLAAEARLSANYLAQVAALLAGAENNVGPVALIRSEWRELPVGRTGSPSDSSATSQDGRTTSPSYDAAARADCERLRDLVLRLRAELPTRTDEIEVEGISKGSQPLVLWGNRQRAARRLRYSGDVVADVPKLKSIAAEVAPGAAALFALDESDADAVARMRESLQAFCGTFPDTFCVIERGPYFAPTEKSQQRLLTAGFHLMQGYFRDDRPLYDLILDDEARRQIDALWDELDLITDVPQRQYKDFIFFERAEPPRFMREAEFDFARSEDKDAISADKMQRLRDAYLAKAIRKGAGDEAQQAIRTYFADMSARIRWVEQTRAAAEPGQLAALADFAQRAWRRPLEPAERDDLLAYYRSLRTDEGLSHEDAVRDALASVLLSPQFCYRFELVASGPDVQPLTDYELASRLSYFLWASTPDDELLAGAAAGDLHQPDVLAAQARRMLRDPRVRGLASEFLGNLLDIRRFEEHNAVDRERFPQFTNELRQAMFEEPLRFFIDMAQNNRSILDLIDGRYTFVNPVLAAHYGMPESPFAPRKDAAEAPHPEGTSFRGAKGDTDWVRIDDAAQYGRGGLLPMAVFLTKNSPGLRTSPVKRGYWVVRRLLDEHIPPPPPTVPELPKSETDLGDLTLAQTLARHRADNACAGCHQRFDSIGLVFEDYGPIGERRKVDLGGRAVDTGAIFPDGKERHEVDGLRNYLRDQRQADFLNCFTGKLFAYALGRTLLPSDEPTLRELQTRMAGEGYTFDRLVESIVTSPQFLRKRGRAAP